jgi:uridine kinase
MNKIILIAGGSASGKTYVANSVLNTLKSEDIIRLTIDDFYKDNSHLPLEERRKINFDHPKSIDFKLLHEVLSSLKEGKEVDIPTYDFTIHCRSNVTKHIIPRKIIIVEGIFALVNKRIRELSDLNIFINASSENRFLRRLKRDQEERGRTFDYVVNQYVNVVAPAYEEIIAPTKMFADLIISNDGIENKSLEILTSIIKMMLEK